MRRRTDPPDSAPFPPLDRWEYINQQRDLTLAEFRVLSVIAQADGDNGAGCCRSLKTIAKTIGKDRRTVRRAMRSLEARGLIRKAGVWRTDKGQRVGVYRLAKRGGIDALPRTKR